MTYQTEAQLKTQGTGEWEEVITPIDCNYYDINTSPGNSFDKCVDMDHQSSCVTGLMSFSVKAPFFSTVRDRNTRYLAGERVCYVKSSVPLDVSFLR